MVQLESKISKAYPMEKGNHTYRNHEVAEGELKISEAKFWVKIASSSRTTKWFNVNNHKFHLWKGGQNRFPLEPRSGSTFKTNIFHQIQSHAL